VTLIAVALWDAPVRFPPPLEVELGPLAPRARLPDVREALEAAEIPCTLDEDRGEEGAVLVTGSRVEITFHAGRLDEMIASAPIQA
jgi:hypothetical protein